MCARSEALNYFNLGFAEKRKLAEFDNSFAFQLAGGVFGTHGRQLVSEGTVWC